MNSTLSNSRSEPVKPAAEYATTQPPALRAICDKLAAEIDKAIPHATLRIWHGSPVWFIGEDPIVGYRVRPRSIELTFWSGQLFDEPLLKPAGKDKAAQFSIRNESEVKPADLRRWLKKSRTTIFDYVQAYAQKRKCQG